MNSPIHTSVSVSRHRPVNILGLAVASLAFATLSAQAISYQFSNAAGGDYQTAGNWTPNGVPNLSAGDTAQIANGSAVTYNPGGDLTISNGGVLQVSSGSFTQINGNAFIQLGQQGSGAGTGNGTVLVNGGTFNQGTASSNPFAVTGTGNVFRITSGTANISTQFTQSPGLATFITGGNVNVNGNYAIASTEGFTMSGGNLNLSGEFDFNTSAPNTLSGGMLTTTLVTGLNAPTTSVFNISGGTLRITTSGFDGGFYGGDINHAVNFTNLSNGQLLFSSGTETQQQVMDLLNRGAIVHNGVIAPSDFSIVTNPNNGFVMLSLVGATVPEPSSVALTLLGVFGLVGWVMRRQRAAVV